MNFMVLISFYLCGQAIKEKAFEASFIKLNI